MPTALTVDDEANIRLFVKVNLMARGIEVIEAETAEMALDQLRTVVPDVILLDISLPGANGWELLQMMTAERQFQKIPVIVLSGTASLDAPEKAGFTNIVGHLTKPVATPQLMHAVTEALQKTIL